LDKIQAPAQKPSEAKEVTFPPTPEQSAILSAAQELELLRAASSAHPDFFRFHKYLIYYPNSGLFVWRARKAGDFTSTRVWSAEALAKRWNTRYANLLTGCLCKQRGYIILSLENKTYLAQRVAWLMQTGHWPNYEIDHWDKDKTNNKWENLREATTSQNHANTSKRVNNASGYKGVVLIKSTGKYKAQISVDGSCQYLGTADTPEEAHELYKTAAREVYGEFFHE